MIQIEISKKKGTLCIHKKDNVLTPCLITDSREDANKFIKVDTIDGPRMVERVFLVPVVQAGESVETLVDALCNYTNQALMRLALRIAQLQIITWETEKKLYKED